MKTLNIGLIGAGGINQVHAQALSKIEGARITAIYNHNIERAISFNEQFNGRAAECFDDWERMLTTRPLDAVYVALPPGAHVGQVELAAAKGMHLMLEKPIALTLDRAQSIATAARNANVLCQIGHHMRHCKPVRHLKQLIDDGTAGRPLFMQGRFFVNGMFPTWWRDPQLGGGQLVEQSIHLYDLARHFFGEAKAVSTFADNLNHTRFADYRVDDASASIIRFHNGGIATLCATNLAEPGTSSIAFTVQCEKLSAEFESPQRATFAYHDGRTSEEAKQSAQAPRRELIEDKQTGHEELSINFITAIRDGSPLRSSIDDGVESLRLVLAAATSAREGGVLQTL
ncbi:MAG TPA: Gfo/Idh/MocA family oxidoreductase [Tepidisphaeraceae bacterium]|jgi:predicted dehydrogenase